MSRFHSYLNSAKQILNLYKGTEPFPYFIKEYFRKNRKFGSADRKHVNQICYSFFRTGKALGHLPIEEKMLFGLYLTSSQPNELLEAIKPELNRNVGIGLKEKISMLKEQFSLEDIFPYSDYLSSGIDPEEFILSHFVQPLLFLRLRPGYAEIVKRKLNYAGISFTQVNERCMALSNRTPVEKTIEIDTEAVIQDYNSQQTVAFIESESLHLKSQMSIWDCCAGSGGKSILAYDLIEGIDLTVSDIRETMLINLKKRFERAGIKKFKSFQADLSQGLPEFNDKFDLIICDAPCTGSGTWARTPEQLYYFEKEKIRHFSEMQKAIVSNTIPGLKSTGYFLYITCSVFRKENEEIVEFIIAQHQLELIKTEVLSGYDKNADTMFVALFKKG